MSFLVLVVVIVVYSTPIHSHYRRSMSFGFGMNSGSSSHMTPECCWILNSSQSHRSLCVDMGAETPSVTPDYGNKRLTVSRRQLRLKLFRDL